MGFCGSIDFMAFCNTRLNRDERCLALTTCALWKDSANALQKLQATSESKRLTSEEWTEVLGPKSFSPINPRGHLTGINYYVGPQHMRNFTQHEEVVQKFKEAALQRNTLLENSMSIAMYNFNFVFQNKYTECVRSCTLTLELRNMWFWLC
jgi:hypothetical protein